MRGSSPSWQTLGQHVVSIPKGGKSEAFPWDIQWPHVLGKNHHILHLMLSSPTLEADFLLRAIHKESIFSLQRHFTHEIMVETTLCWNVNTDDQLTHSQVIYPHQPPKACDWKPCLSKMASQFMSWTCHSLSQMFSQWRANAPPHTNIALLARHILTYLAVLHNASSISSGWVNIVYLFICYELCPLHVST